MSDSDKQALLDGTATIQTEIVVYNKNLFDKENIEWYRNGSIAFDDTLNNSSNRIRTNSFPIEGGKTYIISGIPSGITLFRIRTYDTYGGSNVDNMIPTDNTFTLDNNIEYINFVFSGSDFTDETNEMMKNANITLEEDTRVLLTETNSVIDWNHEDFRYVKDEGWIGQFIARQVTGTLKNTNNNFTITDRELEVKMGIKIASNTPNWYSLGNFLVTKVTDDEVKDKTTFEALDYTKKFNKTYVDRMTYPCTASALAQDVCNQCDVVLATSNFKNYDYVIEGNVFTNNESCRDVMKAIGKLAFSWVRVDWDNKVYIDFDPTSFKGNTTPSQYNTFGNNKYYNLKTQKEVFGPVNRVVIGYGQIEGEKTKIEDAESIAQNGLCEITVFDNPLVYTQEQRESIIESARDLFGFTYTPLNTLTVGHPWLKGNELVRVSDMENVSHDTIPFDRTIQYFGHIKTLINSSAPTKTNDTLAYSSKIEKGYSRTEIIVDKLNKEVTTIVEEVMDEDNPDSLVNKVETLQTSTYTKTEIQRIVDGTGVGGVKVSAVESISGTFDIDGMHYEKMFAYTKSTINETGLEVLTKDSEEEVLFAGYDVEKRKMIVRTENLNAKKYLRIGVNSRVQDYKTGGGVFIE